MQGFWAGFEKRAEEGKAKSKSKSVLPYALGAAGALGLGALGVRKFLKSNFHYRGAPSTEGALNRVRGAVSGFENARPHAMRSSAQTALGPVGAPELSTYDHMTKTWSKGSHKDMATESGRFRYDQDPRPILTRLPEHGGWEHYRKFSPRRYKDNMGRSALAVTKSFFKDKPSKKALASSEDAAGFEAALEKLKETGWQ